MKSYSALLICIVGAAAVRVHDQRHDGHASYYGIGYDHHRDYSPMRYEGYAYRSGYDNIGYNHGHGGYYHGMSHGPSVIDAGAERPCHGDLHCIRNMAIKYGNCKPPTGKMPDPIFLKSLRTRLPVSNMSVIYNDVEFRGTGNFMLKDIYINKITGNLVIVAYFDKIVKYSPRATVRFQRKDKEPLELEDFYKMVYDSVTLTTTVPITGNTIRWARSETSTHLGGRLSLTMGPKIMHSSDPTVQRAVKSANVNLENNAESAWTIQSAIVMGSLIQAAICDIGENIQHGSYNLESLVFGQ